jgi:hypothetical protein
MSEVEAITETFRGRATKSRIRKVITFAGAALVGAAALAVVSLRATNSDTPEK